ncbi:MAG: hypothetical protein J6J11_10300 [Treponema sp.]|nr:hypothetical protein [Clostridia bacterium]MBP3608692.1 hypothetical protein [Treponema sp.]
MKNIKLVYLFFLLFISFNITAQEVDNSIYMDFRNQKISDIIYSIAELCGESVIIDETVTGSTTFRFEDENFERALYRFAESCQLSITKKDNVFFVSKVSIEINVNDKINLNTENVNIESLLNLLSRETNTTILYDSLPSSNITIRVTESSLEDILNLIIVKLPNFGLERIASGYYLAKSSGTSTKRNIDVFTISNIEDKFSVSIQRASLSNVIDTLFKKAKKEYSFYSNLNIQLENISYSNKDFDEILSLILKQANCDYSILDNIFYIFDVQKKDITKSFKETKIIQLRNISIETFLSILPSELNNSNYIKIDKTSNSVILNGSSVEINPIISFIEQIDKPVTDRFYEKFDLENVSVSEVVSLIPKSLLFSEIIQTSSGNSFITQVTEESKQEIQNFIKIIDTKEFSEYVTLKYITTEELLKSLPPSVAKSNIIETNNSYSIFFKGTENQYKNFCKELEKIDQPKQQIKYQILVIQRQRTNGINWSSSLESNVTTEDSGYSWNGLLSNIFNINFDIISKFGVQFAGKLNIELSEGKSKVLADTTLNGLSGETINFSNTNTYRYRDIIVNTEGDLYTSTTREIASGLTLNINGWASGDDMVTVKVDAQVSKQGSVDSSSTEISNPPSTSEKKVSTSVRTKNGEPVIIGGLIQQEEDTTEKAIPILSKIPLIGNIFKTKTTSIAETEFIIYLVPLVQKESENDMSEDENLARLRKKYEKVENY